MNKIALIAGFLMVTATAEAQTENWICDTSFGNAESQVTLYGDHDKKTGWIQMGGLPKQSTDFFTSGLDRIWAWSYDPNFEFQIGPSTFGLEGYYLEFRNGEDMAKPKAVFDCEETSNE